MITPQPVLNRSLLQAGLPDHFPEVAKHLLDLPERAVQFGTGAFLRGFVGSIVDEANRSGQFLGRVVAIGSTGSGREQAFTEQQGLFTLSVRGVRDGQAHREDRVIAAISRALHAREQWPEVLSLARDSNIAVIFSNTTEAGIRVHPDDSADNPITFPARLTRFLLERAYTFDYACERGLVVLPCELIENNATHLKRLVLELAERWRLDARFARWLEEAVPFCNTLVDRIVTNGAQRNGAGEKSGDTPYHDRLYTVCEPYRLFAIEADPVTRARIPFPDTTSGLIIEPDIGPYRERKLRLLNGAHTILAPVALQCGCRSVGEAVRHELTGPFLRRVLIDELVPAVALADGREFAAQVLERFANPHIEHALLDVVTQATIKYRVRVFPSLIQLAERRGQAPPLMAFSFAAFLLFTRAETQAGLAATFTDESAAYFRSLWQSASTPDALIRTVCSNTRLWGHDLERIPDFVMQVSGQLARMLREGVPAALAAQIAPLVTSEQS